MVGYIAVDLGGTQIRAALYPSEGTTPLDVRKIPTLSRSGTTFERMCNLIESIWPKQMDVLAITVASPGPQDPETGVFFSAPNIPGWENFPLRQKLQERFHCHILMGNDANLAALGEWMFGAGQGHKHLVYLTISTGIGGGVIVNNQLLTGARGLAGEMGHITVLPGGPLCGCGQRGHLEAIASGPAIAQYVNEELARGAHSILRPSPDLSARDISAAAEKGDTLAIQALARAGQFIGQSLASIVHIFNPSIIILGGGVSRSGALLLNPLRAALEAHIMDRAFLTGLEITTANLGDDAGLLGALALGRLSHPPH
ncbi:MAG: ROK family protein [Anaerolineales bacterium]